MSSTRESSVVSKEKPVRKLIWKALTLALLIVCFIFLPSPQRTRADWASCDADRSARNTYCSDQYDQCVWNSQPDCQSTYNACLDQSAKLHHDFTTNPPSGCIFDGGSSTLPLPVIDTSITQCLQSCQDGADMIENGVARFTYLWECGDYCEEKFPKQ